MRRQRQAVGRRGAVPDFVIIGAQKSGTSSLFHYLAQHPQLVPSRRKEVHFFDGGLNPRVDNFARGPAWYRAHFPPAGALDGRCRTFEASPLYLFNPLVARRMSGLLPEARLVAVLRDPTRRAISHYFHERRAGREPLPIMEALLAEEQRLAPVLARRDYKSETFIHCSYKSRGRYREQLERFLRCYPRDRLLVIGSERLFRDPRGTLRRVFEFVGVDADYRVPDLTPRNVGAGHGEVHPDVCSYLDRYFMPHNAALHALLGEHLGWWPAWRRAATAGRRLAGVAPRR